MGNISGAARRNVEFKDAAAHPSSPTQGHRHYQQSQQASPSAPPPPSGLEAQTLLGISHNIPSKAALARRSSSHGPGLSPPGTQPSSQPPPALQSHVSTTHVGPHPTLFAAAPRRSASTALAGTHLAISAEARAGRGPFPESMPTIMPMVRFFGLPNPLGHGHNADSDLMHQYPLSVLQWSTGPARRNPSLIIAATCRRFHAVILQEASDHVPQVSGQFIAYTGDTDHLAEGTHLSPTLQSLVFTKVQQQDAFF